MSTKSTIAHGGNFHFFHEGFDDEFVYLRLEDVPFEASNREVTVQIPIDVWEVIRHFSGIEFDLFDKTDKELRERAEREVEERIEHYEQAVNEGGSTVFLNLAGSLVFGDITAPRDKQIENAFEYYCKERARQQEIKARMKIHQTSGQ